MPDCIAWAAKKHLKHAGHDSGGHRREKLRATDAAIHQLAACLELDKGLGKLAEEICVTRSEWGNHLALGAQYESAVLGYCFPQIDSGTVMPLRHAAGEGRISSVPALFAALAGRL
jgi:hypothetical protein